jgi:hypothetical protein
MRQSEVRNWLGKYFLIITAALGGYIILFAETPLLPISRSQGTCILEIIAPTLLAQVTLTFQWFGGASRHSGDMEANIPKWVTIGPPIAVISLIACGILTLVIGNVGEGKSWAPSPAAFQAIITLCVSLLNGSTVFIMASLFRD